MWTASRSISIVALATQASIGNKSLGISLITIWRQRSSLACLIFMVAALASILVVHRTLASEGTCVIKPEFVPFFSVNVVYIMQLSENCSQSVKITNNCQERGNINKSNVKHSLFVQFMSNVNHSVSVISFFNTTFVYSLSSTVFH